MAKFELELTVADSGEGLEAALVYRRALFEPDTVARMAGHLAAVLEAMAAAPERRLSEISLLRASERAQVLEGRSAPGRPLPRACVHELLAVQAGRTPGAVAVVSGGQSLTYGELERRADRLARSLRRAGVGPETTRGAVRGALAGDARGDAGDPQGRRRLRAAGSRLPGRAPGVHGRGLGRRRAAGGARPPGGPPLVRGGAAGSGRERRYGVRSEEYATNRGAGGRRFVVTYSVLPTSYSFPGERRVRDLHLRLHGPAQGGARHARRAVAHPARRAGGLRLRGRRGDARAGELRLRHLALRGGAPAAGRGPRAHRPARGGAGDGAPGGGIVRLHLAARRPRPDAPGGGRAAEQRARAAAAAPRVRGRRRRGARAPGRDAGRLPGGRRARAVRPHRGHRHLRFARRAAGGGAAAVGGPSAGRRLAVRAGRSRAAGAGWGPRRAVHRRGGAWRATTWAGRS